MEKLFILLFIFIIVIGITNEYVKEEFSNTNSNKKYTEKKVKNKIQGTFVDNEHIYVIYTKSFIQLDKKGNKVKEVDLSDRKDIQNLQNGIAVGNIFIVNNSKNKNTIEVFDKNLNFSYTIKITGGLGNLIWIDYFQGKWWGCFAHYKKDTQYTVVVEFYTGINVTGADSMITRESSELNKRDLDTEYVPNWGIRNRWYFSFKIYNKLTPYSLSGGSFRSDGKLCISDYNKRIYMVDFYPTSFVMQLDYIQLNTTPIIGISWDRKNDMLYTINPIENNLIIYDENVKPIKYLPIPKPSSEMVTIFNII